MTLHSSASDAEPPTDDPAPGLAVQVVLDGGHATITVAGELDIANFNDVRMATLTLPDDVHTIVFEMSCTTFMDSSGVTALLEPTTRGVTVRLRDPSPAVRLVVEVTGLHDVLTVES